MDEFSLRAATREDLDAIRHLWERLDAFHRRIGLLFPETEQAGAAWLASFERTLGRFSFLWVAESGGEVCAFLLARLKRAPAYLGGVLVGEISDLFVEEALRGKGVAAGLTRLAVDHLRSQGAHSIEVQILSGNEGALAFWEAQGFESEIIQVRLLASQGANSGESHTKSGS